MILACHLNIFLGPVKQYHRHEFFIEMGERCLNCYLISFYSLKLYFYKKKSLLITKCVFVRFLFPKLNTFKSHKTFCHSSIWTNHNNSNCPIMDVTYFSGLTEHDKVGNKTYDFHLINLRPSIYDSLLTTTDSV